MRSKLLIVTTMAMIGLTAYAAGFTSGQEKAMSTRIYELRTYTTVPGRLPALHKRFAEHTIKLFEKHGMKNGMYWVPTDEDNKLIYVVVHESREAADKSWKGFQGDPDWHKARDASEAELRDWITLARYFADCQLAEIEHAARSLAERDVLPPSAPVIGAGCGRFIATKLGERLNRPYLDFGDLIDAAPEARHIAARCAPAVAVALLAPRDA